MGKLRFAPLVRVSTEKQERQGESLQTQRKQIQQYVKTLDGYIPDGCWRYSGQEHATPGQERENLDRLLKDSGKGVFDAIIVCDASRWSRDNAKSKAGLEILRQNGIRFFVGSTEYDLFSPQARLFLGMSTEMNEFFALEQSRKSMENRIERARKGIPTGGKLPYGRTYDKETGAWGIDEEKAKNIKWSAGQYLKGESLQKLAKTLNMNMPNLWKILTKRSGDKWEVRFGSSKLNINESVQIKIPRLLDQETIDRIHERAASNKTFTHGHIKHQYLLSRMIFCADCGYTMFGQTNHGDRRYYRHPRYRKKECDISFWVRADDLEGAVIAHLFGMYGDIENMEKAMLRAIPDASRIGELREQEEGLKKRLEKAEGERQRLIKSIAKGIISDSEAERTILEIRERTSLLTEEIEKIRPQVEKVPTEGQIRRKAKLIKRTLEGIYTRPGRLSKMSFDDKRKLAQMVFAGKTPEGARCGVYVKRSGKAGEPVIYEIKGLFGDIQDRLPVSSKQDSFSKCHAHNGFCVYKRR